MTTPLISIIIPAYNVSRYIPETLDSVLQQTFTGYEVIVVNDGSPDTPALEAVLEPYRDRIVYLNQANQGPSAARNTGIRAARGEYVAFLDGDDLWAPEFLAHMMNKLCEQQVDAIYCDTRLFGDTPNAGRSMMEFHPSNGPCTLQTMMECKVMVFTSTLLARKSAVMDAGLFDEQMWRSEDFDLWSRMVVNGARFGYDRAVLGRRRVHAGGLTASEVKMFEGTRHVFSKLIRNPKLAPELRDVAQRRHDRLTGLIAVRSARQALHAGDPGTALELLRAAGASSVEKNWKMHLAIAVLSVAPALGPIAIRWWHSLLLWRRQARTGRTTA